MAITISNQAVTSGADYDILVADHSSLPDSELHRISVSGAGTGTITVDFGEGFQSTSGILSSDYDTFLLPGAVGIKVAASGGNISFSSLHYNNADVVA